MQLSWWKVWKMQENGIYWKNKINKNILILIDGACLYINLRFMLKNKTRIQKFHSFISWQNSIEFQKIFQNPATVRNVGVKILSGW